MVRGVSVIDGEIVYNVAEIFPNLTMMIRAIAEARENIIQKEKGATNDDK